jgi:hypothetical protein
MANSYLQSSEQLELSSDEEVAWVRRQLDDNLVSERDWELPEDGSLGFDWQIFDEPAAARRLSLYAEESGDPLAVGRFVQAYLKRFQPEGSFALTYACTCDKPRAGEFGGGAIFVTAKSFDSFDAHDWLAERAGDCR